MQTFTHELIRQDARRASLRAAFSLFVTLAGFFGLVIAAATGNDLIGW